MNRAIRLVELMERTAICLPIIIMNCVSPHGRNCALQVHRPVGEHYIPEHPNKLRPWSTGSSFTPHRLDKCTGELPVTRYHNLQTTALRTVNVQLQYLMILSVNIKEILVKECFTAFVYTKKVNRVQTVLLSLTKIKSIKSIFKEDIFCPFTKS